MKKTILILFLFVTFHQSYSTTYYVSPLGNNSNSGTSQLQPFQTLQHASNQVAPGDTVFVMQGVYTGFTVTTSGTTTDPIVFSAQTGVLINIPNATNDGINLEGADYIIVEGFHVFGVPRAGLRSVLNTGVIFRNNKADSCGKWGILTGFSENILIEGNECSRSADEHGIYFSNSADNPIIRNNHCWGNNANGIHMNGDVSLQPGDGIISNALVENNIIHDNGNAGGSGINCDGVQSSIIRNNLLFDNHASGISLYMIDGGDGSMNNLVVNNTIVQPSVTRWALNISDGSTGNTVFNNIFYSDHSFRGSISIDVSSLTGFVSDYNVTTDRMSNDGGNSNMSLAQWQSATALDNHSIVATPAQLFVDVVNHDYHLSFGSPAKNIGINSLNSFPAPLYDFEGNSRPQGIQFDIGCYEFLEATSVIDHNLERITIDPETSLFVFETTGRLLFYCKQKDIEERLSGRSGCYILTTGTRNYLSCIFE